MVCVHNDSSTVSLWNPILMGEYWRLPSVRMHSLWLQVWLHSYWKVWYRISSSVVLTFRWAICYASSLCSSGVDWLFIRGMEFWLPGWNSWHFYSDLLAFTLTVGWIARVLPLWKWWWISISCVLIEELDATGSGDGTLRAWSTLSGAEVRVSFWICSIYYLRSLSQVEMQNTGV